MSFNYGLSMPEDFNKGKSIVIFRILTDPDGTNYPEHVLPVGLGNAWITPYISPTDL